MPKPEKQFERDFYRLMDPYPVLETPRLRLRRVFRADAADLFEATSDPYVTRYEPWGPYTMEETVQMVENIQEQLESGLCCEWAVERKDDAKVLGLIHLNKIDFFHRSAEIGYWFSRKSWGFGYATECVRALTEYAINTLRMDEIIAVCHPDNPASIRVLEKAGMKFQQILPAYISLRGNTADCKQYHITRWDMM
ncbi:MAG: GNAT family N-acetyltransferase [Clostridia bacterium]|nr:GNAT family N-acetyltransferase [Clostridia bacterium]